jgi:toxin FitB
VIILDTNVLSELMRRQPSREVLGWAQAQSAESVFTTTICEAEIFYGLALLPQGKRRSALEDAAAALFADFAGRVLPFDSSAAREFGAVVVACRRAGRPISVPDAEIAAIARSRGARVATRDVADFSSAGVEVEDPWGRSAD